MNWHDSWRTHRSKRGQPRSVGAIQAADCKRRSWHTRKLTDCHTPDGRKFRIRWISVSDDKEALPSGADAHALGRFQPIVRRQEGGTGASAIEFDEAASRAPRLLSQPARAGISRAVQVSNVALDVIGHSPHDGLAILDQQVGRPGIAVPR